MLVLFQSCLNALLLWVFQKYNSVNYMNTVKIFWNNFLQSFQVQTTRTAQRIQSHVIIVLLVHLWNFQFHPKTSTNMVISFKFPNTVSISLSPWFWLVFLYWLLLSYPSAMFYISVRLDNFIRHHHVMLHVISTL